MKFITNIISWLLKNTALLVGIVESLAKVIAGIISLTPTKSDDKILPVIDKIASAIKKYLYSASDVLAGKEINIPNS